MIALLLIGTLNCRHQVRSIPEGDLGGPSRDTLRQIDAGDDASIDVGGTDDASIDASIDAAGTDDASIDAAGTDDASIDAAGTNDTSMDVGGTDDASIDASDDYGYGPILDPAPGKLLDTSPIKVSAPPNWTYGMTVASDGADYLIVWTEDQNPAQKMVANLLNGSTGQPLNGDGYEIIPVPPNSDLNRNSAAIVYGLDSYLLVWYEEGFVSGIWHSALQGQRIGSDGKPLDPSPHVYHDTDSSWDLSVGFDGIRYLLTWSEIPPGANEEDVFGLRIGTDGKAIDTTPIKISTAPGHQSNTKVQGADGQFLVGWSEKGIPPTDADLYVATVSGAGIVTPQAGVNILPNGGFTTFALAYGKGTYFVLAESYNGKSIAMRLDQNLKVLDPTGLPLPESLLPWGTTIFDGTNFFLSWAATTNGSQIGGLRFDEMGLKVDPNGFWLTSSFNSSPGDIALARSYGNLLVLWQSYPNNGGPTPPEIHAIRYQP